MSKITRRKFLGLTALTLPAVLGADARFFEPTSLRVTKFNLSGGPGDCRFVHFTDFHHKGNVKYAAEVVRTINKIAPEFVCFTGDLVEDARFAAEALGFIAFQLPARDHGCDDLICVAVVLLADADANES